MVTQTGFETSRELKGAQVTEKSRELRFAEIVTVEIAKEGENELTCVWLEGKVVFRTTLHSLEVSRPRWAMRHWIVFRCFIAVLKLYNSVLKYWISGGIFYKVWAWRAFVCQKIVNSDCTQWNLLEKNLFRFLATWRDSFRTGGLGLLGCKSLSHGKGISKEPVPSRQAKRSKWAIN